jgi:hypothetical protein
VHDSAFEVVEPGQLRKVRNAADAGGEDQMARVHEACAGVLEPQRDVPLAARGVVGAALQRGAGPEIQLHCLDVRLKPVRQFVFRDVGREARRERQIGQVIDVYFVVQRQRVVAFAPVVADAFVAVDDQRIDAERMQPRRDRQPGLAAAHDEHRRITVGEGALLGEAVKPVLGPDVTGVADGLGFLELFVAA